MASLAQMERELTIERTRAGLEVARKRQMTDSKIKSAKKLLASGDRLVMWPATSESPCRPSASTMA
jgi:DNA invertase Pin-like site-specific DNA recombinase